MAQQRTRLRRKITACVLPDTLPSYSRRGTRQAAAGAAVASVTAGITKCRPAELEVWKHQPETRRGSYRTLCE